ncbi:hypothetical protein [Nitritalea halalkaliphila]|uniref:hypothetical protein n=1 Tax=Nitritalea halalkaliphila TaxID=590849 RepID=UPI002934FCBD|nr:hypothetical protein [Nitritalea halalkaliphila]
MQRIIRLVKRCSLVATLFLAGGLSLAASPQWLRYPAISPDGQKIAFTYKGDIFIVPSAGGSAEQWTSHEGHDFMPVWSPDGKQLAYASDRYGNFDVFVLSLEGGEERRLTFHSNDEFPYTFTPDGKQVLFSTTRLDDAAHRQYPTGSQPELYQVAAVGGRVDQVWTLPAEAVAFSRMGSACCIKIKRAVKMSGARSTPRPSRATFGCTTRTVASISS